MILATADRELRALVGELRDDAAVAERVGVQFDATAVVSCETGALLEESRNPRGLFAIDGAVVARNDLDPVAHHPGPPPAHIRSGPISYRVHRNALEMMDMIATLPIDPDER